MEGILGLFSARVGDWLAARGSPAWAQDLVADGLIGSVGMVVTFSPILMIFFATLGFLEDTGYMARAAYVTDRFMHIDGLAREELHAFALGLRLQRARRPRRADH